MDRSGKATRPKIQAEAASTSERDTPILSAQPKSRIPANWLVFFIESTMWLRVVHMTSELLTR